MAGEAQDRIDAVKKLLAEQRLPEAEEACRQVLIDFPGQAEAEQLLSAIESLRRQLDALAHPDLMKLGERLLQAQQFDLATEVYRRAAERQSDDVAAVFNYGTALEMQGRVLEAVRQYDRAQRLRPRDATRILSATRLPMVYDSVEDLKSWRNRLRENLDTLRREGFHLDIERIPAPNLFLLAYQGLNDRELLIEYASLIAPPPPAAIEPRRDRDGRIHVGFVSMFLKSHTIGRINKGLIAHLDRGSFHVTVFQLGQYDDEDSRFIRAHCDRYVDVPRTLPEARQVIASSGLDVLIYTDIGMDNVTWTLAHSRLAPVQAATWGHPSTTGIPTIDYFISSALLEPDPPADHYSERLIQLPNLSVYYYRPEKTGTQSVFRPPDANVYGCLQSLFKLHPDFDPILDEILRRNPKGIVLVPHGPTRFWDQALLRRLTRTMPQTVGRIRFFEPLPYEQYLQLSASCDVLLAPIHFGAGNTSYEALAFGTPTVTMPSEMLKGRITHGLYRAMGVMDCVASSPAEYAELTVMLGTQPELRNNVRDRILAANHVLYENPAGVRDLERFLQKTTGADTNGPPRPTRKN